MTVPPSTARRVGGVRAGGQRSGGLAGLLRDPWELVMDAIGLFVLISLLWSNVTDGASGSSSALVGAGWVVLLLRRRWSATSLAASLALAAFAMSVDDPNVLYLWCFTQLALFSYALRHEGRRALIAAGVVAATLAAGSVAWLSLRVFDATVLGLIAWTAAAAGLGSAIRLQRVHVEEIAERARLALEAQERDTEQRITLERLRIAADLHDVLAHHVAVINVHAGSAEAQLPSEASGPAASMRAIRVAAGGALTELQRIVGLLRDPETDPAGAVLRPPAPGTDRLPELIDSFRQIGMRLSIDWPEAVTSSRLEPAADLAVYRVVQESLTNAQKHGSGSVEIVAGLSVDHLHVSITNHVRDTGPEPSSSGGFGLLGMRERVASAGGTMRVDRTGGRFTLAVALPLIPEAQEEA